MLKASESKRQRISLPDLIGWCSVCLISSAWGPILTGTIRDHWGCFGVFGLLSGLALGRTEQARTHREAEDGLELQAAAERQVAQMQSFCSSADA